MAVRTSQDVARGLMRLDIIGTPPRGHWELHEFEAFLGDIDASYTAVGALLFFVTTVDRAWIDSTAGSVRERQKLHIPARHPWDWTSRRLGRPTPKSTSLLLDELVEDAERHFGRLTVHSLSYASPGWVEVIGALNPLKVVLDFILGWRDRTTHDEAGRFHYHLELLDRMDQDLRNTYAPLLLDQSAGLTRRLAVQWPIGEVHVIDLDDSA
jgi:hypothetical protein